MGSVPIVRKQCTTVDTQELNWFKKYVDHVVCTVKADALEYLECAIFLHKNLKFTLQTPNSNGNLEFPDLNTKLNGERQISCHW